MTALDTRLQAGLQYVGEEGGLLRLPFLAVFVGTDKRSSKKSEEIEVVQEAMLNHCRP